jgi:uncharacterized integral membrane protein (TIGR02327 family)
MEKNVIMKSEGTTFLEKESLIMISGFGQQALVSILSHLIFISLAWWALQALRFDQILRPNRVLQARLLYIVLSIAIGSSVSNFFLDYLLWSQQLPLILQTIK